MSAKFLQKLVDMRTAINLLMNHRHDALYEPKGTFVADNLMINADKQINQRGDIFTPTPVPAFSYTVDMYYLLYNDLSVTCNFNQSGLDHDIGSYTVLITVLTSDGSTGVGGSNIQHSQNIPENNLMLGREITYTAQVKSNTNAVIEIDGKFSSPHSGSGEYEILSVTGILNDNGPTCHVWMAPENEGTAVGDYIQIGREKLEYGNTFTGFERASYAERLDKCLRYMQPLASASTGILGVGVAISTTDIELLFSGHPMDNESTPSISITEPAGATYVMQGPGSGTIDTGGALSLMPWCEPDVGQFAIKVSGTGFVVGEINLIRKGSFSDPVFLSNDTWF